MPEVPSFNSILPKSKESSPAGQADVKAQPDQQPTQEEQGKPVANVRGFGFRAPKHDYLIVNLDGIEMGDEINKRLSDINVHPSSIINIEAKFKPDASVDPKNTIVVVFYKTKIENSKYRVDHFYSTVGRIESDDDVNKQLQLKNISINDVITITSARVKTEPGRVPNIMFILHFKRQSNGADLN